MYRRLLLLFLLLLALPARAALEANAPDGFVSVHRATIAKEPAAVWAALVAWQRWWSPAHSYSGSGTAFRLEPVAGGLLREDWPGGSVLHATVVAALPPALLRLRGGFGPLQGLPVDAVLEFQLKPDGRGTALMLRYSVGGAASAGLPSLAAPVDSVMGQALARLVKTAEAGRPDAR